MFEKEAKEYSTSSKIDYVNNISITLVQQAFKDGSEFGYNKAKEEVKQDLMTKLKDEGIVKPLKDSIMRNERLSSQEQQELCAWIECAMDFGENLDECAKELEQIRNERNLFQEKCEDIELNYYCDKLDCQFLSRNKWHFVKDEGTPKVEGHYLVCLRNKNKDIFDCWIYYDKDVGWYSMKVRMKDIYAWKEITPPKESK